MRTKVLLLLSSLMLALSSGVARADALVIAEDGTLRPATEGRILVVLYRDGEPLNEPVPALSASAGSVRVTEGLVSPGVYAYRYEAPLAAPDGVTFTIGTSSGEVIRSKIPLAPASEPTFAGPRAVEAVAGEAGPIGVLFRSDDVPSPEMTRVAVSEGAVTAVEAAPGGLLVRFKPSEGRFPRMALVGIWDARRPGVEPAWAPVYLSGHPRVPMQTEPSARVWMSLGSRSYGPFVADDRGEAVAVLDVRPGEENAAVRIEDAAGNVQRTTLNVNPDPRPVLAALVEPVRPFGGSSSPIHLAALTPGGSPWSGEPPRCRLTPGGRLDVLQVAPGIFRTLPAPDASGSYLDQRADCDLAGGAARTTATVPIGEGVARTILLRIYPQELSADFPMAQVQAVLEDLRGVRLPPGDLRLGADSGEITVQAIDAGVIRAEYNGAKAVPAGRDRVWARFDRPSGTGIPTVLEVVHGAYSPEKAELEVLGRLRDGQGGPVAGASILLSDGTSPVRATTDARGWASATLPLPPQTDLVVLEASFGELAHRFPFFLKRPDKPADRASSDLDASIEVPISAGRVREVFITADPTEIASGPSSTSRIQVRLVDRFGNPVADESVQVRASVGRTGMLKPRSDGSYETWFSPPSDLRSGTVRLTVSGKEGEFAASTEIRIVPSTLRFALGIGGGGITNFGSITSPLLDLTLERRLPLLGDRLVFRLSGGFYDDSRRIADEDAGTAIHVRCAMFPLTAGVLVRQETGSWATWLGAGLLFAPFHTRTDFGSDLVVQGTGLAGPGLDALGGVAARTATGEVGLEARYLFVNAPQGAVGYSGSLGGLAGLASYRILF